MSRLRLKNRKVLVIGFGRTGESTTDFLIDEGAIILVNDIKNREEFNEDKLREYEVKGVKFILGKHLVDLCYEVDLIIISPGVDPYWIPFDGLREKGIKIISEIELAYRYCRGKIIGITGTNGKTTVTKLLGELFNKANMNACVCGNIGTPFIKAISSGISYDYYIIEISSFQLEAIEEFRAHGAILLNISEDHFDRYKGIKDYLLAKWNIFKNQKEQDWAILNKEQENYWKWMNKIKATVWEFSLNRKVERGCYLRNDMIYYYDGSREEGVISLAEVSLKGMHNIENVMAVIIACKQEGLLQEKVKETIKEFKPLPHRMELIATINGISFINDSKATNTDAVIKALEGNNKNVVLILGGKDKKLNYDVLVEPIKKYVKAVILIGEAKEAIGKAIECADVDKEEALTMEEAVSKAYKKSEKNDIVLLSPACSSFDMFKNYEERGNKFKEAVLSLINKER